MPTPVPPTIAVLTKEAVEGLIDGKHFSDARRRLAALWADKAVWAEDRVWLAEKLALCTYKDAELQSEAALEAAYGYLKEGGVLDNAPTSETLSLAGAIQKRLGEVTGSRPALNRALGFYTRARTVTGASVDEWTYAAINMAYLHDILAVEEDEAGNAEIVLLHRQKAGEIRRDVAAALGGEAGGAGSWWRRATLAEALLGLGRYADAAAVLSTALKEAPPNDWQAESTARQLAALACLPPHAGAEGILEPLTTLRMDANAARALLNGKVGLALSGGGFRAALFHAGVLARLAELDLLRHVEVLSCVSGGSILGVLYYLELKARIESQPDARIRRALYVEVVESVHGKLLQAMRHDIRTKAFVSSLFAPKPLARRTERAGALLDRLLFDHGPEPLTLRDLVIEIGETPGFHPQKHNWRRRNKVPILIINATTLNTGHCWQFAATWMGEPPAAIEPMVDAGERLRRLHHPQAPTEELRNVPLGTAVAASAAVPGLFRPVALRGLYPDRTVALSDGGVHDNQGIFSLLEQDCRIMIVSDGCGQLPPQVRPRPMVLSVLQRANDILMGVVRRSSYRLLSLRRRSGRLKELHFAHLKTGLATTDVTWAGGTDDAADAVPPGGPESGLDERVQRALAALRTDLDRFSETECLSLMAAGYQIAGRTLARDPSVAAATDGWRWDRWVFLPMLARITAKDDPALDPLVAELRRGSRRRLLGVPLGVWGIGGLFLLLALLTGLASFGPWIFAGGLVVLVAFLWWVATEEAAPARGFPGLGGHFPRGSELRACGRRWSGGS